LNGWRCAGPRASPCVSARRVGFHQKPQCNVMITILKPITLRRNRLSVCAKAAQKKRIDSSVQEVILNVGFLSFNAEIRVTL
jgi:hypothetical protein